MKPRPSACRKRKASPLYPPRSNTNVKGWSPCTRRISATARGRARARESLRGWEKKKGLGLWHHADTHRYDLWPRQAAFAIPSLRRGMLAEIRTEVSVHVIQSLPNRLQRQVALHPVARKSHRVQTFR